jgi:hypothetical protein
MTAQVKPTSDYSLFFGGNTLYGNFIVDVLSGLHMIN